MPSLTRKVCGAPGCYAVAVTGQQYCEDCGKTSWGHWQKQRGTKQERGYGAEWERRRVNVLKRDNYLCQTCKRAGRLREANAVDHVIARSDGGSDDYDNLESICNPCHSSKTAARPR